MKIYTHIVGSILFYIAFAYLINLECYFYQCIHDEVWISVLPDVMDRIEGKHRGLGHSI